MFRFVSLVLLAAYLVLATPRAGSPELSICEDYMWGVIIVKLPEVGSITIYNQYIQTQNCDGPAWVQSSTNPDPPTSIRPQGTTYECKVPTTQYYCGSTPVATCCGKLGESA